MNPLMPDSSDKSQVEIKAAPDSKLDYVIDRVNKGYAITINEAKLLVEVIARLDKTLVNTTGELIKYKEWLSKANYGKSLNDF